MVTTYTHEIQVPGSPEVTHAMLKPAVPIPTCVSSCPSCGGVAQPSVLCSVLKLLVKSAGEDQDDLKSQNEKIAMELDSRERNKVQEGDISYFMPYACL